VADKASAAAEPATVLHHPRRSIGLVFGVRATLDRQILFESALGLDQPLGQRPRHRASSARRSSSRRRASRSHRCRRTPRQRALVTLAKPRDRRVIGARFAQIRASRRPHTAPLDSSRRALADPIGGEQQRDHHRRIVRRPTAPIDAIGRHKRGQIHRCDRLDHKPRQMVLLQSPPDARRQQELLLTGAPDDVPRHTADRLHRCRRNRLCNSHHGKEERLWRGGLPVLYGRRSLPPAGGCFGGSPLVRRGLSTASGP
jgi:hypothetical protein